MTTVDTSEQIVKELIRPMQENGGLTLRREITAEGKPLFVVKINKDVGRLTPYFDLVGEIEAELMEREAPGEVTLEYPD